MFVRYTSGGNAAFERKVGKTVERINITVQTFDNGKQSQFLGCGDTQDAVVVVVEELEYVRLV
jgi:TPP-dependent trihydroxycyclohexane-1,2-dione (THcHDO) dehydratase